MSGWMRPPSPQSVEAITFSLPDLLGEADDALGDELRMLEHVGRVADDAGQDHLAVGQLLVLPHDPLVLVPGVRGLERVRARR